MRRIRHYCVMAVALVVVVLGTPCRAQDPQWGELITIGSDLGVHPMLPRTSGPPHHSVILLAGGNGVLNLNPAGEIRDLEGNFLVRSAGIVRSWFFNVAIVDAGPAPVSPGGLTNQRLTQAHADFIGQVIGVVRTRWPGTRVWLIGTSNGTLSVVNAAARLTGATLPDGIVLTSAVTQASAGGETGTVLAAAPGLANITVPTLVIWEASDTCAVSPAAAAISVFNGLTQLAPQRKSSIAMSGSHRNPAVYPCSAFAAHGYPTIESDVVSKISDFLYRFP